MLRKQQYGFLTKKISAVIVNETTFYGHKGDSKYEEKLQAKVKLTTVAFKCKMGSFFSVSMELGYRENNGTRLRKATSLLKKKTTVFEEGK